MGASRALACRDPWICCPGSLGKKKHKPDASSCQSRKGDLMYPMYHMFDFLDLDRDSPHIGKIENIKKPYSYQHPTTNRSSKWRVGKGPN